MCGPFLCISRVEQLQTWAGCVPFDIVNLKTRPSEGLNLQKDAETKFDE